MKKLCQPDLSGVCSQCGKVLPANVRRTCSKSKSKAGAISVVSRKSRQEKLGDWTERQLKRIGITEERYKEAKEKFGLSPTCSCPERKKWLNDLSDWWRGANQTSPVKE